MKLFTSCCLVLVVILAGTPVQALEPWVLYDNFNGTAIDPNKWQQSGMDESSIFDVAREIRGNRLHLLNRTYGDIITIPDPLPEPPLNLGNKNTAVRLQFPDPNAVTAMKIVGTVTAFDLEGCGGNTDRVRALRISGFFFNTYADGGHVELGSGNIDDVIASIHLETRGSYEDPPDVLRVIAFVSRCIDPECFSDSLFFREDLGEYRVGDSIRLLMRWDEENDRFIFRRDDEPAVIYNYAGFLTNAGEPGFPQKRLGISNRVANCPEGPRPVAFIEALVNRVAVNESAAP